jgi:hypothetical protein
MSIPFVNFNRELGAPFYGRSPLPKVLFYHGTHTHAKTNTNTNTTLHYTFRINVMMRY